MPSRAARPPNEAPYPTLVGTATSGTPVRPPTTEGSAPSMPATTTRQSAAASRSRTASSRCRPGHADVVDAVHAGAVHADGERGLGGDGGVGGAGAMTATVPRGAGSGPRVTARATRSSAASGSARGDHVEGLVGEPGGEHGAVGVPLVQGAQDRDDLLGGLAGAVDDLGVAGARRAVDVDAGEAEVGDAGVGLVHAPHAIRRAGTAPAPAPAQARNGSAG